MKVETTQHTKAFAPVSVIITLESQRELDSLAAIFNYSPIATALGKLSGLNTHAETIYYTIESCAARTASNVMQENLDTIESTIKSFLTDSRS